MPRGFSKQERVTIRKNLMAQAKQRLANISMSKISVDELARAAHISKGAFYQFFSSKEELFIALFTEAEQNFYQKMRLLAVQPGATPRLRMLNFLQQALTTVRNDPMLCHFTRSDLEALLHGLSPEQAQEAIVRDIACYGELLEIWRDTGLTITCSAADLAGIVQTLFIITLYNDEFDNQYLTAKDFLLEAVAEKLVKGPET